MTTPSSSASTAWLRRALFTLLFAGATVLLPGPAAASTVYVSNTLGNVVSIDGGNSATLFATGYDGGTGMVFDSAGNLYLATTGSIIEKFTPAGAASVFADGSSGLNGPFGLAFDSAGNLFVANHNDSGDNILKITPDGKSTVFADSSVGISEPLGLAFDSSDNLYVANEGFENVLKITPDGTSSVFAATGTNGLEYPFGIAVDVSGNIFVSNNIDSNPGTILRFTPNGTGSIFATSGLDAPQSIALDAAGNLYVANEQNSVEEFSPDGTPTLLYNGSLLGGPEGIAVGPTPAEPIVSVVAKHNVAEYGGGVNGVIFVSRAGTNVSSDLPVYFKLKGTAQEGTDFQQLASPITIPAGAAKVKIKIKAPASAVADGTRTLVLELKASPTSAYEVGSKKAVVTIEATD